MKTKIFSISALCAMAILGLSIMSSCSKDSEVAIPDNNKEVSQLKAKIAWKLVKVSNPTADQLDAYNRITSAMNAAVARYNKWGDWGRTLTVYYQPGVPTAQANINGQIWFGSNRSYMTECTAMHEMSHCFGVGTASKWSYPLIQNYLFVGPKAVAKMRSFNGSSAVINTGGQHFWPYGLNYNSEWSATNGDRNAQIVRAMNEDGL